jgi:hypothetical protein
MLLLFIFKLHVYRQLLADHSSQPAEVLRVILKPIVDAVQGEDGTLTIQSRGS